MKKKLIFTLALAASALVANPVLADKGGRDRDYRKHDQYRYEHRIDHNHRYDRRHDYRYYRQDHHSNRYAYRLGYHNGKRQSHQTHNHHYNRYDDDWYKWIAGAYLAGELIHHLHGNRVCYDRH